VHRVPLAARSSYTMSNSTVSAPRSTVVEVVSGDGAIGHVEACLASEQFQPAHNDGVRSAPGILAPTILGLDPLHLNGVHRAMDGFVTLAAGGPGLGLAIPDGTFGEPEAVYRRGDDA